jgi:hypothetical protein
MVARPDDPPVRHAADAPTTPVSAEATTTLVVGSNKGGAASWMTLLTVDPQRHRGAVVYIPAHTAAEVAGQGLQGLGEALRVGGRRLLLLSAENFLGARIDHYVGLTRADSRSLFDGMGPLSVDVPADVRVATGGGNARLVLNEGGQGLSRRRLTDLLYVVGLEGDDVELGGRHLAFWEALLDRVRRNPAAVRRAVAQAGDAFDGGDAHAADYASVLSSLGSLPPEAVRLTILPVRQVSVGGAELYAADQDEMTQFLRDTLPLSSAGGYETDIQILNGNGEPGVGREAAELLLGRGFRLVRSGNAADFDHRRTLIVTYDTSARGRRLAQRARRLLGVGQVLVSAQEQGIVDLTIVVGRDFLREH